MNSVSAFANPSEAIFPPQKMPLKFSHRKHMAKGIACDFCHEKAPVSRAGSDMLIPPESTCETCHPIDRENPDKVSKSATACGFCHAGFRPGTPVERVVVPPPNLRFDHAAHAQKGITCARCHGDLASVDVATRAQLPRMPLCLTCHDSGRVPKNKAAGKSSARCATCHLTQADGTLVQQFSSGRLLPSGTLRGDMHGLSFRTNHAQVARSDEKYCGNCHRQDFCIACHNGVAKPLDFHGNDYVSAHAVDARKNIPDCSACHRAQTFCLACHQRLGIVDLRTGVDGAFKPLGPLQFHPAGWADPVATSPSHHAWQAQRNLRQCVSCHRQETCLECHASNRSTAGSEGKMWINPHPPDWAGSNRCESLARGNLRMCLRCHAPDDTARLGCRR